MYKALDIANWFLIKNNAEVVEHEADNDDYEVYEKITHLKLQKLLYYAQGISLAIHDKPLFRENIVAWPHGPVVKEVYDIFCKYGRNFIDISEDEYNAFFNDTQKEIEDTGKIIENIYIENTITIRKQKVPVDQKIYLDEKELSKYLLFGTTEEQQKYVVKAGDTIEDVAFENKMSTEEFLISNPSISNAKSLLYAGQEVTLGILKPQFNVVEKDYVVIHSEKKFTTETRYDDSQYVGYVAVQQKGSNGLDRVAQSITKINGETTSITPAGTEVIKEPITEIIIKGGKKSMYNGYGTVIPTKGEWGWPASCSSISSPFGYRWGMLHDGTDIAGCGYGSNVFAAMDGTVIISERTYGGFAGGYGTNGEYITIDHHNGYYTMYNHLCPGCRYVKVGDTVCCSW